MNNCKSLCAFRMAVLVFGGLLGGCNSSADRAQEAHGRYELAAASGDLPATRRALRELVAADDDVADYWVELGKTELALGDYGAAYGALERAHELDRANPAILAALTQLALRSGELQLAEGHARKLELVAPEDPAVRLTYGYVALRRGDFNEANEQVAGLLAAAPYDPSANILRSRILLRSGQTDKAVELLREQIRQSPSDELSLRALLPVHELYEQWPDAAVLARSLTVLQPKDQSLRARLVENELRAGQVNAALNDTAGALGSASPREIDGLLSPWLATGHAKMVVGVVAKAAGQAEGERRLALARFLASAGEQAKVAVLVREQGVLPLAPPNLAANALYGSALVATGSAQAGSDRLNAVLAMDPANADGLRARAQLRSRAGSHKGAIEDAQKLVASDRKAPAARLLLARIYVAAGRPADARRVLWEAFHDIPADRTIFEALRAFVNASDGPGAVSRLTKEFDDQRNVQLTRSFA